MPTLPSMAALEVVMTTSGAASDDKVDIKHHLCMEVTVYTNSKQVDWKRM